MNHLSRFRSKRFVGSSLVIFSFLFASVALANIVSGVPTTNQSSDVAVTKLTLGRPAVAGGTFMLANISVNGGSAATITAPAGWTQVLRTDKDTNISLISYWKVAGTSEPSSYTWFVDNQTTAEGGITPYTGVDISNPIDASAGNTGYGTLATTTSVTTNLVNDQVVALLATDLGKSNSANAYFTTPIGMTEKYDVTNTPFGPSTAQDEMLQAAIGSTGSKSSTISGNKPTNWVTQTIALRMQTVTNLSNGIIAYWKLDGDSTDATGNGHNGTDTAITYGVANGKLNQGAHFDPTLSSTIAIADSTALQPTSGFTVNAWVKVPNPEFLPILQSYSQDPSPAGFRVDASSNAVFTVGNNNGSYTTLVGRTLVDDNNWHMLTFIYDGAHIFEYVDGVLDASGNEAGMAYGSTNFVQMGCESFTGGTGNCGQGSLDEVGFWNRALTTTEITQLYNSSSGRQYPF